MVAISMSASFCVTDMVFCSNSGKHIKTYEMIRCNQKLMLSKYKTLVLKAWGHGVLKSHNWDYFKQYYS